MRRRIIKKRSESNKESRSYIHIPSQTLACSKCGSSVYSVGHDAVSVICWRCCFLSMPHDSLNKELLDKQKTYPRGWRKKERFVDVDGEVYIKGVRQPNLKGKYKSDSYVPKLRKKRKKVERKKRKSFKEKLQEFAEQNNIKI